MNNDKYRSRIMYERAYNRIQDPCHGQNDRSKVQYH